MYGLTRGIATLLGVAVAGILIWLAADAFDQGAIFEEDDVERYWAIVGVLAAAGLIMALSQVVGGWTKWGRPRLSAGVFLLGFVPALIAGGWVLIYLHPGDHSLADNVRDWSDDLGIENLIEDLTTFFPAIAFALGLVLGLTLDTAGPRVVSTEAATTTTPRREPVAARYDEETVVGAGAATDEEPTRQYRRDEETVVGAGAATEEEPTRQFRRDEEHVVGAGAATEEEPTRQIRSDEETVVGAGAASEEEATRQFRRDEEPVMGAGAATEEEQPTRRRDE
jgi:hypothetical protein